jgi:hypothetical protein
VPLRCAEEKFSFKNRFAPAAGRRFARARHMFKPAPAAWCGTAKKLLALKPIRTILFAAKQISQRRVSYFLLLH